MLKEENINEILFEPKEIKTLKITLSGTPVNVVGIREVKIYEGLNTEFTYASDKGCFQIASKTSGCPFNGPFSATKPNPCLNSYCTANSTRTLCA